MKDQTNHILLVDDEVNVLTALKRMLHREPYVVHSAKTADEALALLKDQEVSLIISDYRMPEMNGVTFLQEAKKQQPDSVRIILSGFADIGAIIDAVNRGEIFKFIAKPWNDVELKMTISQSLDHWQLMKRNKELSKELLVKNRELHTLNGNLEEEIARRSRDLMLKDRRYLLSQFIVEHTPIALLGIDDTGMIAMANRSAYAACGKPGGALIGNLYQQALDQGLSEVVAVLIRGNKPAIQEIEIQGRTYSVHFVPVQSASLSGCCLVAIMESVAAQAETNR
jgi:two-component system NtrC family sensor kinase